MATVFKYNYRMMQKPNSLQEMADFVDLAFLKL